MSDEGCFSALLCHLLPRLVRDLIIGLDEVHLLALLGERLLGLFFVAWSGVRRRNSGEQHLLVRLQEAQEGIFVFFTKASNGYDLHLFEPQTPAANVNQEKEPLLQRGDVVAPFYPLVEELGSRPAQRALDQFPTFSFTSSESILRTRPLNQV